MTERRNLNPPGMTFAGMSQGVALGDLIHVSGQVALRDGKVTGIGDAAAQARQCFANIEAVLRLAGATMGDIVALRCYLVDAEHYAGYASVKNALFAGNPPCGTAVVVKALLSPGFLLEVEAVAQRSPAPPAKG